MRPIASIAFLALLSTASGYAQNTAAAGNGPYAGPVTAAYADLANAATQIVTDAGLSKTPTVIYDATTFSSLSAYQAAVEQLRVSMTRLCPAPSIRTEAVALSLDFGGAASGLAALLAAVTPAFAIQGQSVTFDNTALIAAFAHADGDMVIFPAYLPPAAKQSNVACGTQGSSSSVVDLWYGALAAASALAATLPSATTDDAKKAIQARLDAFQKVADAFLAVDKGPSMLSKLLTAESLLRKVPDGQAIKVIDLRLDSVGIDSTTRTVLFWRSTKFNSAVMAHYTVLNFSRTGSSIDLQAVKSNNVAVFSRANNADKFVVPVKPAGNVNGVPVP
jgi:hypothetical protein